MNLPKTLIVTALSAAIGAVSAVTITLLLLNQVPQQVANADATPSPTSSFIISPSPSPTRKPVATPDIPALRSLLTLEMQNYISGLIDLFWPYNPNSGSLKIKQAGTFFTAEYIFTKTANNYSNTAAVTLSYNAQCKYLIKKGDNNSVLQFAGSLIKYTYPNPDYSADRYQPDQFWTYETLWTTTEGETIVDAIQLCPDYFPMP